jgi:hypothetical protein
MTSSKRNWLGISALLVGAVALTSFRTATTSAQMPAAAQPDMATALGQSIQTQVVTLKVEDARGEPHLVTATAKFDRPVVAYWLSVVGADIKFTRSTEKQINRLLYGVDPFAKVINGKDLEISGKLGIRDGSGNWDDSYEGTITVSVTAVLGNR